MKSEFHQGRIKQYNADRGFGLAGYFLPYL